MLNIYSEKINCVCMYVCICTHTRARARTHIHNLYIYIYIYIHIYIIRCTHYYTQILTEIKKVLPLYALSASCTLTLILYALLSLLSIKVTSL